MDVPRSLLEVIAKNKPPWQIGRGEGTHLASSDSRSPEKDGCAALASEKRRVMRSTKMSSLYRSHTRMPERYALVAYAGPMPRLVVPILPPPRASSRSPSTCVPIEYT